MMNNFRYNKSQESRHRRRGDSDVLKPNRRREFVALTILIIVLIAVLLANGSIPTYADICEQAKDTGHENCTTHNTAFVIFWHIAKFLEEHNGAVTAISTLIIAVFTWRLWWSTDKLWKEARAAGDTAKMSADAAARAADVAEKTLIFGQRAYVSGKGYGTDAIKDDSQNVVGWNIDLSWENTGNTPAIEFTAGIELQEIVPGGELLESFEFSNRETSPKTVVGAKDFVRSGCRLTFDQAYRIRSGKIDIFLRGRAEYRDIFPQTERHHTLVCVRLSIKDPTFKHANPFGYNAYQRYNEAT